MPADATWLPTEPDTPASKTPFPTGMARSTTPLAGRPEVLLPAKSGQRSTSLRVILVGLVGLAGLAILALASGIAWFTLHDARSITEFPLSTNCGFQDGCAPGEITAGPDGNLWFTELASDKIGRISSTGTISEFPVPTAKGGPFGITAGPDGNVWFTEHDSNKIGLITTGK